MTQKAERHREILAIVRERSVATQRALRRLLKARGHAVDQATLSRDIHELALVKVPENGTTRYAPVGAVAPDVRPEPIVLVARFVRGAHATGNLVVLTTDAGNASPVAEALDHLAWNDVVGTIAGENTVFVACRNETAAKKIAKQIADLGGGHR